MSTKALLLLVTIAFVAIANGENVYAEEPSTVVVRSPKAGFREQLAAREIRRYAYLRTGELLPIIESDKLPDDKDAIVVANANRPMVGALLDVGKLGPQQHRIQTLSVKDRRVVAVVGGDDIGTLYGAYRMAEHLGVRFFLHGDVVPDEQVALTLPQLDETGRPLFELRGVNPWGSHPFGFDLWNTDDYKSHIAQLAKMRMNFIGMHCYPEGNPYAEPTVWIGRGGDFDSKGVVSASYPSRYYTAAFSTRWGGLRPGKTGDYHLGAATLFDRDDWGPEVMRDLTPQPSTPEGCNALFNRTGAMYRDVFAFARQVGVKTCIGTEAPLTIPLAVQERLKTQGKNPADPAVVAEVYQAMFRRIAASHPLDYYWLWTPEVWTWRGNDPAQMKRTIDDVKIAQAALKEAGAPFELATCGWVLGPKDDRARFDKHLPSGIALSAISRHLGEDPVDPAYGRVERRDKWAIPWMEGDNGGLAIPQLWVGRTRQDAVDARRYGCTGLMGLIWRTRILGPNISQLARAGWQQPWDNQAATTPPSTAPKKPKEGAHGGKIANYAGTAIAETENDVIYQSCRYDTTGYDLQVPNGTYRVTLQFCEPHFDAAGKRICDVTLQGKTVIKRLDIFAEVGKFAALDHSFDAVTVTDGQLKIGIGQITSMACISGIIIEGKDYARKINCGGPALGDFTADFPLSGAAETDLAKSRLRKVPCEDFYHDWATTLFGPAAADEIADVFARIDSRLPRPLSRGCPAGVRPNMQPWEQVAPAYAFVDELARCRAKVTGPGNLERFDYWLGTMQYLRAGAKLDCATGKFIFVMKTVNTQEDPLRRKQLAREAALPAYREIITAYTEAFGHLLDTTNTNGALATVMYWEHSFYHTALGNTGQALSKALGEPLPPDAQLPTTYQGRTRLIVPTVRGSVAPGEALKLHVLVLSKESPRNVTLHYRKMGDGAYRTTAFQHVARGIHTVAFPTDGAQSDVEYYVEATIADGKALRWPAPAPRMSQTVILLPKAP